MNIVSIDEHNLKNLIHITQPIFLHPIEGEGRFAPQIRDSVTNFVQINFLHREEKEELSVAINDVRNESNDLKQHMAELELKYSAAERVVAALRDTLKEERLARNRAEAQCGSFSKVIFYILYNVYLNDVSYVNVGECVWMFVTCFGEILCLCK